MLVATPELLDPNFAESVVLMARHDEEGAFGLVLTQPLETSVDRAWEQVSDVPCHHNGPLYCGGPCPGPLTAIHTQEFLLEMEILSNLYASMRSDHLEQLVVHTETPVRFFAGLSGWAPGQLEAELLTGSWQICQATPDHVFSYDENLWETVRSQIASSAVLDSLGIKHKPADPSVN